MTAREMFIDLGYECTQDDENYITYIRNLNNSGFKYMISFYKNYLDILMYSTRYDRPVTALRLDKLTLKAINKQVEELGL